MKSAIEIVKATYADINELAAISRKTFYESFANYNSEENMKMYLDEHVTPVKLQTEMKNPDSEFYFAKKDGNIVGYLKINFASAQNDVHDSRSLEIERIYISNAYYGKGYGQLLFNKAMEIAKANELAYLWLGVWENNEKAIKFYERNGMSKFGQHSFMLGNDRQTDILMKRDV